MASKAWISENPKVSAYITTDLRKTLKKWMKQQGIKKESQAIAVILNKFFEGAQADDLRAEYATKDEVKTLSEAIDDVRAGLAALKQQTVHDNETHAAAKAVPAEQLPKPEQPPKPEKEPKAAVKEVKTVAKKVKTPQPSIVSPNTNHSSQSSFWPTKDVESKLGISRKKLEGMKKHKKLPQTWGEYVIVRWAGKQEQSPFSNLWEIQETGSK